ncbi:MAG: ATP-dependent sacrificial sulfur transferase LarE [Planctomycetes bacterium]|nr:ATP-dependent sacrificial sulfur transferase LarE [Planctomycetota bacterium]
MQPAAAVSTTTTVEEKRRAAIDALRGMESVVIAYSGGIDSVLVARLALDALGAERVLAVTGESESLSPHEREEAARIARELGIPHLFLRTEEVANPLYQANPPNRCYFCKTELYARLASLARERGFRCIVNGTNLDDLGDFRPGLEAAREKEIRSPLVEAGFRKEDVRALAHALGVSAWAKPATACLSSRFPYGTRITPELLAQVAAAEDCLRDLGFSQFRVRHHDAVARLELAPEELPRAVEPSIRDRLVAGIRAAGYRFVALDLLGYRTGSLNELLPAAVCAPPPLSVRQGKAEPPPAGA